MSAQKNARPEADRKAIKRIVIAGGGTAGWMVAAGLSKILGKILDIRLIESDDIGTVGVGEATIPSLLIFHRLLGISEQEFMAATQATFKLGISFENWRDLNENYTHSFGLTGKDHWTAGFHHFWMKGRARQLASEYGDYCLEFKAAQQGRFAHLPKDGLSYAYHLDATLYARFLRKFSEGFGAQRIEGKIVEVKTDVPSGDIRCLRLDSGAEIEGDLFIDCTGFRGLLIGDAMNVGYEDWSHWLHNDSAVAVQTTSVGDAMPYTRSIAHGCGWQWRIPLQHRVGNGLVYSSRHMDDEHAKQTLLANIQGQALTQPRHIKFRPGQRRKTWSGNCIAIGLSSGFLEPLESTSIHLIQRSIVRLMQLFPASGICATDIAEFNQQSQTDIEHIRDFIILHYKVTNRQDTPYWQACRTMEIPESLRHRIELFRETGRVFRTPGELFTENSWTQVMLGQGITPRQHHQVADLMGDDELSRFLNGIKSSVNNTVQQLPTHQSYVEKYCRAHDGQGNGNSF
jgi:tryptophan halogenase